MFPSIYNIYYILKIATFRKRLLFVAMLSAFLVTIFEGISITLIIPILSGLTNKGDFSNTLRIPLLGNFFKALNITSDIKLFFSICLLILLASYLKIFFKYLNSTSVYYSGIELEHSLKNSILEKYLNYTKEFFDSQKLGGRKFTLDSANHIPDILTISMNFMACLSLLIIYAVILFAISWKLTLLILISLPVLYFPTKWLDYKLLASANTTFHHKEKLNNYSSEMFSKMDLIRNYSKENDEASQFSGISAMVKDNLYSQNRKLSLVPCINEFMIITFFILILILSLIYYFRARELHLPLYLAYLPILHRFLISIPKLQGLKSDVITRVPFLTNITNFLRIKSPKLIEGNVQFDGLKSTIVFSNVSFGYDKGGLILKDINLTVKKGKITAIVGPTGSGKTTLANLIPRFYEFANGKINIDGVDIRDFSIRSLRAKISIVSQEVLTFNDSIRHNICYGIERSVNDEILYDALKSAMIFDFVASLPQGLDTIIGDGGIQLSRGERQRLSIAMAILKKGDILILDEATSALDYQTEEQIQNTLRSLLRDRTTIVIAHRLSTIKNSDWIVVLEGGRIIEQGTMENLLKAGKQFRHYFDLQKFY